MQQYSGPEMNDYGMHVVNLFLLLLGQEFSLILQHSLVCFLHPVTKSWLNKDLCSLEPQMMMESCPKFSIMLVWLIFMVKQDFVNTFDFKIRHNMENGSPLNCRLLTIIIRKQRETSPYNWFEP